MRKMLICIWMWFKVNFGLIKENKEDISKKYAEIEVSSNDNQDSKLD